MNKKKALSLIILFITAVALPYFAFQKPSPNDQADSSPPQSTESLSQVPKAASNPPADALASGFPTAGLATIPAELQKERDELFARDLVQKLNSGALSESEREELLNRYRNYNAKAQAFLKQELDSMTRQVEALEQQHAQKVKEAAE